MKHLSLILLLPFMPLAMGLKIQHDSSEEQSIAFLESYTFKDFVAAFNRSYSPGSAQWNEREKVFLSNMESIISQQKVKDRIWNAGINKFLDWTEPERKVLLGHKASRKRETSGINFEHGLDLSQPVALSVDWRSEKKLSWSNQYVRDQGACGSCWAVAATTCLEAHMEMVEDNRIKLTQGKTNWYNVEGGAALSAQNLVSCTPNPHHCGGTGGCEGATEELAYDYVKKNGIQWGLKWMYSSGGGSSGVCDAKHHENARVFIQDFVVLPSNRQQPLLAALSEKGPVTVSVAANHWFSYESGVFDACMNNLHDKNKADFVGNHAVVAWGYGEDPKGGLYWLIKNSWGPDWGEHGFMRLSRSPDEASAQLTCGMDTQPEDGSACDGETEPVRVCGHCGILYESSYPVGVYIKSS